MNPFDDDASFEEREAFCERFLANILAVARGGEVVSFA